MDTAHSLNRKIICSKCGVPRERKDFRTDPRKKNGLRSICKVCDRASSREYYASHAAQYANYQALESTKQRMRNYVKEHNTELTKYKQNHYEQNKEVYISRYKLWRKKHPDKALDQCQRRRARKSLTRPQITSQSAKGFILEKQHNRCCYCGRKFTEKNKPILDHLTPLSKGGAHVIENLAYACRSCNSRKGANSPLRPVQTVLALAV
jgi:5-methylcytosine-specific restriction endonuclease McrA